MPASILIYSYSRCSTCRKALSWLDEKNLAYDLLDIVQTPPTEEMLRKAADQLGSRKPLFNTSGQSYRAIGSAVVKAMSDQVAFETLALDGKLIKRPFLITKNEKFLVGFKPEVWNEFFSL